MLSILVALRDLRFALPAGFMLGVVPPVVSAWGVTRLASVAILTLTSPFSTSSTSSARKFHRVVDDCLFSLYSRLTVFFFETMTRTEIIFYGEKEELEKILGAKKTENVLVISNHQTTADWMIVNMLAARVDDHVPGPLGHIRYVMKSGLKFLPLIGFYLGPLARGGVFVKRTPKDATAADDDVERTPKDVSAAAVVARSKNESSRSGAAFDLVTTTTITTASRKRTISDEDDDVDDEEIESDNDRDEKRGRNSGEERIDDASCDKFSDRTNAQKNSDDDDEDNSKVRRSLSRILRWRRDDGVPSWLVVYPEGTRFDPEDGDKIEKSRNYARDNRLPVLEHLLSPRTKAVCETLAVLGSSLDAIYHVTIAYSSTFEIVKGSKVNRVSAPSMSDILMGANPRVHVHIHRIDAEDLPSSLCSSDVAAVGDWLHDLFSKSDERLKGFYSLDPGRRGKLFSASSSSSNDNERIQFSPVSVWKTLPTFAFFTALMTAILWTEKGRRWYCVSWLVGTPTLAALAAVAY